MRRRTLLAGGLLTGAAAIAALRGRAPAAASDPGEAGVAVSRFGTDGAALQRAIDSGARAVTIDVDVVVSRDVRLRSALALRFAGGRIVVADDARLDEAVLTGRGLRDLLLTAPVIDAGTRRDGVTAIRLVDCDTARIVGGRLTRALLAIESFDATVARAIDVSGLTVDMRGFRSTAIYLSGVRGVHLRDVACSGGREGVGIYNNARAIRLSHVTSHDHQQDGFVVIAGQDIRYDECRAHANGQSGFATQRQTSGENSRSIAWTRCRAWDNAHDGFDLRGATDRPWGVDTGFVARDCIAERNRATGFYVVKAEGTTLRSCTATSNHLQNLFVDTSDRVTIDGFRSVSGAEGVAGGPNKAGILVYNSRAALIRSAVSGNEAGRTQLVGLALTGSTRDARVIGGDFSGNPQPPVVPQGNAMVAR